MNIVLFSQDEISTQKISPSIYIKDERAKHILKVLHKTIGDTFDAGIINGKAGVATITDITSEQIEFTFQPKTDGKPLFPVSLIVGFPRPIQLKRLFRDVAGLGVSNIYLCGTELGEKSYMDSNIVEKGSAYAALLDGTAQAKSTHVPNLQVFPSVKMCLQSLFGNSPYVKNLGESSGKNTKASKDTNTIKVMLDNVKPKTSLFCYMNDVLKNTSFKTDELDSEICEVYDDITNTTIHVFASIGSERGWTDNERSLFEQYNFIPCSMGQRVLRTETATTVATTLILQSLEVL